MIKAVQDFLNDGSMPSQHSVAGEEKGEGKDDLDDGEIHGPKQHMGDVGVWMGRGVRTLNWMSAYAVRRLWPHT